MRLSQDLSRRSEKFLLVRYPVYVGSFLAINHNVMTYIGWTVTKNVDEITEQWKIDLVKYFVAEFNRRVLK